MPEKQSWKQLDCFFMNNCKIANELRKYRDLAGYINRTVVSGEKVKNPSDAADYADYVISQNLTYLDMVVSNAAYSLMKYTSGQASFTAETIGCIMAGNLQGRVAPARQAELERRLQKLAETKIYILAEHDHQVEQDLYEGIFLPIVWEQSGKRLRFHFLPEKQMPLYQYGEDHRQILKVPFYRLLDEGKGGQYPIVHLNNNNQTLLLRHYLIQELEVLRYQGNKRDKTPIHLLRKDDEGNEWGLLWILGLSEAPAGSTKKNLKATARTVQNTICQLLDNWEKTGYLESVQYQPLPLEKGLGVEITTKKE